MSTSYGFFNSSSGDRVYNADDVNTFLEGIISPNGIYANVDQMLVVTPGDGMAVRVAPGKAAIKHHWFRNTATETLTLSAAHAVLNRWDVIALRLNLSARTVELVVIQGTNASSPSIPSILRTDTYWDLALAYVYVGASVTNISAANITDTRLNTAVCGLIVGLIDQLDTSTFENQLNAWYEEQTEAFENWFDSLVDQLNVNTYIRSFVKRVSGNSTSIKNIVLDMNDYTYESGDVIMVSLNGMTLTEGSEYTITVSGGVATVKLSYSSTSSLTNVAQVRVIKSKVGNPT